MTEDEGANASGAPVLPDSESVSPKLSNPGLVPPPEDPKPVAAGSAAGSSEKPPVEDSKGENRTATVKNAAAAKHGTSVITSRPQNPK